MNAAQVLASLAQGDASKALAPTLAGLLRDPSTRQALAAAVAAPEIRSALLSAALPVVGIAAVVIVAAIDIGRRL